MSINQVFPARLMQPDDGAGFAAALREASAAGWQTVIQGGGTKLGWGRRPQRVDLAISTTRLTQLVAHRHGDLTATVQAGMTLASFNDRLREQGQWLPVESAFEGTTIGGLVSTNESGPARYRHGTPRDLVIGITLAMADGRLVKAGGTVVKNVAGYDLGKLVSGAHGTLAGIVDVTFKLMPLPQASATIVAPYGDAAALARDVAAITGSQLEPAAFDVRKEGRSGVPVDRGERGATTVLLQFASSPAATDAQVGAARGMLSATSTVITGQEEAAQWRAQLRLPWGGGPVDGEPAVVRFSWLPARLPQVLELMASSRATFAGRVMGAGFARLDGDTASQAAAIAALRASADVGHVVVLHASTALKEQVDVWGPPRDSDVVVRALKKMFDPAGILNAGRGPV